MSTLKFWNKNNDTNDAKTDAKNAKNGRNWLHAPDALVNGHVAYLVKFFGSTPVDQPKGIEVVKEAIRRLQFTQQIKKAEGGNQAKLKKVEITISVDGVAVQEPKSNVILHQFPLHKISYCADEKGVKKFFSFIAKTGTSVQALTNGDTTSINTSSSSSVGSVTGNSEESHECFVFISNKLASDITLTIGQAFDLAYRRYMTDSGKQFEITKLQSHNKILENTVETYRSRLRELSECLPKSDLDKLMLRLGIRDICEVPVVTDLNAVDGNKTPDLGIDVSIPQNDDQLLIESTPKNTFAPIVPPRNQITNTIEALKPTVGTKLEGLLLNSDSDSDFDPRADEMEMNNGSKISNDLFGFEPSKTSAGNQLFNVGSFTETHNNFTNQMTSPPPLLAPPPKAAQRRSNNTNGHQDLFGSDPFQPISKSSFNNQEITISAESLNDKISVVNLNAPSFQSNNIENDMSMQDQTSRNPFIAQHNKIIPNQTEMILNVKNSSSNRYDAFRNEIDTNINTELIEQKLPQNKTVEVSPELFKDFAVAAFKEFKVENKSSLVHEFSNKLAEQKKNARQTTTIPTTNMMVINNKMKNGFNIEDFSLSDLDPLAK